MTNAVLYRIAGPVAVAKGLDAKMYDVVFVGEERLLGEVIQIVEDKTIIQVYEDTSGLKPGEPVENTGHPLAVNLGPGLLGNIYDGIQRPLPGLVEATGDFIARGAQLPGLDEKKKWKFTATKKDNDSVTEGQPIGYVEEVEGFKHHILVPPGVNGTLTVKSGSYTINDVIGSVKTDDGSVDLKLAHEWPVRMTRPYKKKLAPQEPLVTGQRSIDTLFPIAKGGTAIIPGPFGAGKCVTGETKILVNDKLMPIREVFDDATGKTCVEGHETTVELDEPLRVWTFNGSTIQETEATHVYRGKTSRIVKVKTRSGREVTLTPIHKLFKLDETLSVVETEAQNLGEGDFIISPRKLLYDGAYQDIPLEFSCRVSDEQAKERMTALIKKYSEENNVTLKEISKQLSVTYDVFMGFYLKKNNPTRSFLKNVEKLTGKHVPFTKAKPERDSHTMNVPEHLTEDVAEFLGYVMGDGMIKGKTSVHFFNKNKQLRQRFTFLLRELFNLDSKEYVANTVEAVSTNSVVLVNFLHSLGVPLAKKSRNVSTPKQLFQSPDSVIKSFLAAYISCDGHVGKRELEVTTASKDMRDSLSYLLLRLGVFHKTRMRMINGRAYYRIFVPKREAVKIHPYYKQERYYNATDIVPMTSGLFKQLLGETKPYELEKEGIPTAGYYVNQNMTTGTVQKVAQKVHNEQLGTFAQALEYVYCDEIVSIEVLDEETTVYDITVPETHNFVGGDCPMILHNTVNQHQLAKWSDADIIVYIGCGERGNEMTDVLEEFPKLKDPRTGKPLMNRTVLIANTSNMPVAAREASIYTGVTIAEYFRDMGYNVAIMADSTSRWAEALREISSRLEEMPGEEGYPAYLASRVAEFYERGGLVEPMHGDPVSLSIIGAVSPPGGDFFEPVTQSSLRVAKVFWALDSKLAQQRHFPSINWLESYSLYTKSLKDWYAKNAGEDWVSLVQSVSTVLQEEAELLEIVQLVGSDALPEGQQLTLHVARYVREVLLQQSAFDEQDSFCPMKKSYLMMQIIHEYHEHAKKAIEKGATFADVKDKITKELHAFKLTDKYEEDASKIMKQIASIGGAK